MQESGIIGHSQKAASDYKIAQEKEQIGIGYSEYIIEKNTTQNAQLKVKGAQVTAIGDAGWEVVFSETNSKYQVDENGTITYIEEPEDTGEGENPGEGEDDEEIVIAAEKDLTLAQYAYNFCMQYGENSGNNQTIYDHDKGGEQDRVYGYQLMLHSGTAEKGSSETGYEYKSYTNKYPMDCVGFVSTMIHHALGMGDNDSFTSFISPQSKSKQNSEGKDYFQSVPAGTWQPGDILLSTTKTHVIIYLGDSGIGGYNMAHSTTPNFVGAKLEKRESFPSYTAYRINPDVATALTNVTNIPIGGMVGAAGAVPQSDFFYNGVPDGKYSVTAGAALDWIIETLKEIVEFLINIIFYIMRMVPVGYTSIVENWITNTIRTMVGEENLDIESTGTETDGTITLEKIIYDEVNIFNVNFFEYKETTP